MVRETFSVAVFTRRLSFYNRRPYPLYHQGFPFYSHHHISYFPYLVSGSSLPVGFSHAKVQQSSGVKHRHATWLVDCPAAFPKSNVLSVPRHAVPVGLVFRT